MLQTFDGDATYARITGIVGRSLKAAGRRPTALDTLLHAPLTGELDAEASILGQIAVDSVDMADLERARGAMQGVLAYWKAHADAAIADADWDALAHASDQLSYNAACLADLSRFIDDPAAFGLIVCEVLPEYELVEVE